MTLYERFENQVLIDPGQVALVDGELSLTYRELRSAAEDLRDRLAAAGARPGDLIGLRMPRGVPVAVGILGILAHGCAYVPLDPAYPAARTKLIADDARITLTVVGGRDSWQPEVVVTGERRDRHDVPPGTAYVIYTSGSTGRPKGVFVGNEHVLALMDSGNKVFDFDASDVWSVFCGYGFDVSVWELWGALLNGGTAVMISRETAADPRAFSEVLLAEEVTVLNQVPTAFGYLVAELEAREVRLPALRYVIFSGEAIQLPAIRRWHELGAAPAATLVNMYGITETTVHATHQVLTPDDTGEPAWPGSTPIGIPLPHLEITVVDEDLRPVPAGTPGQLLVSGAGVTHGYLGRADLTAERFTVYNGLRTFRSGDWAVLDESGGLHYLGRKDRQVQIRGFRVELGEVEAAIAGHPLLAQCAVTVATNSHGEPLLTAHYTRVGGDEPTGDLLRRFAAGVLPPHMVPMAFRAHAAMPTTQHGKVDLAALDATPPTGSETTENTR
ncbi:amino acid adenylation domain-containing protein [Amycolatopsis sp. CA-230715]|uniref:amino acid adenylation domain-containing protein n=1 Tax=Amycolatopsis sp. CA-230715 TaxID=2745196 RepID=UPI001C03987D|nr:amino acid adenylation domain-containing protein [Amycolatopsis sp. CA-230715]QWF82460.1 Dimodular nonribosomal peptide synthase [Amycolatopsis sp. CA-230715]